MRNGLNGAGRARVVALLAVALIVRALVPAGWMPVATGHGLTFELCASQGPIPAAMAMHHGRKDHGGQAAPDHPCAFAGLGLAADTAPPLLALAAPAPPPAHPPAAGRAVAVGRGLAAPPPPATGPPAFA